MQVVVGLGNPGTLYAKTPHNIGFEVVDALAKKLSLSWERRRGAKALLAVGDPFLLVKPTTYMNRSGEALLPLSKEGKMGSMLIVADDIDLPFGTLRLRAKGSSGGHNGLKSIEAALQSQEYDRLRIGVGKGYPGKEAAEHVLEPFGREEMEALPDIVERAVGVILLWAREGITSAMNRVNGSSL